MQHYISKANFLRITNKYKIELDDSNDTIYKKTIYFFSKFEINRILTVKQFLINAKDEYIIYKGSGFIKDSYSFVHEESHHAKFHLDSACTGLNSVYRDLEIPIEIQYRNGSSTKDIERINQFRAWFKQKEITELYYTNQKRFMEKLQLKFHLINPPRQVELSNGGIQKITNYTEKELEQKIETLIKMASTFYNQSVKNRDILVVNNYSRKTFYITSKRYQADDLSIDGKDYTNEEIRNVLKDFYVKIKKPLIDLLIDYWIVKLNPTLDFNKSILDQLDFEPCKMCCHSKPAIIPDNYIFNEDVDIYDEADDYFEFTTDYVSQNIQEECEVLDDLPF